MLEAAYPNLGGVQKCYCRLLQAMYFCINWGSSDSTSWCLGTYIVLMADDDDKHQQHIRWQMLSVDGNDGQKMAMADGNSKWQWQLMMAVGTCRWQWWMATTYGDGGWQQQVMKGDGNGGWWWHMVTVTDGVSYLHQWMVSIFLIKLIEIFKIVSSAIFM